MTTPATYRKRPVVIEAIQYTGSNWPAVQEFTGGDVQQSPRTPILRLGSKDSIEIATLEGIMVAEPGDWIIRGIKGELYPCKPDICEATYEPAPADPEAMREAASRLLTAANKAEAGR